jgi:hypothetical protein
VVRNVPVAIKEGIDVAFAYEEVLKEMFEEKIKEFFGIEEEESPTRKKVLEHFREEVVGNNRVDPKKMDVVKSISLCFDIRDLQRIDEVRQEIV